MTSIRLLIQEVRYRKLNFALSVLAVVVAASLFVAAPVLIDAYHRQTRAEIQRLEAATAAELGDMEDQTRRLMRDMGFNLLVVHRDTNMADFWHEDFSTHDMPQEYVDRLAQAKQLTLVTHLVATLQEKIKWNGRTVLLAGYLPETAQAHMAQKKPMGYRIEPGTVFLGFELGAGRKEGDEIELNGRTFRVAKILPEKGSKEDITIAMSLHDAQRVLDKPRKINQILALGCRCDGERLPQIRRQLGAVLPETKITEFQSIALARAEQRELVAREKSRLLAKTAAYRQGVSERMEKFAGVATPLVVLACGIWVGILAMQNVRDRRTEIGLLRAVGKGSVMIGSLFLGRGILLGLLGGAVGFFCGTWLAAWLGAEVIQIAPHHLAPTYELLPWTMAGAVAVCALASYAAMLSAVLQDPAVVLRDA